mmetsp:Transcript_11172/g.31683  ORF Transcript_11172/g.31683 Transcript_11172/m.31683 type:complete len:254 (-) Transcript_11172:1172-1933(-)
MAKLMEQRLGVVVRQQCGGTLRALGKVVVVEDDGQAARRRARFSQLAHPRPAALIGTAVVVVQEDCHQAAAVPAVPHLVHVNIGMVRLHLWLLLKAQPKQLAGHVKHRSGDGLQAQVGLELSLVEVVAVLPHLLGVVPPVPRLNVCRLAVPGGRGVFQQGLPFGVGRHGGFAPHVLQQLHHTSRALGHCVCRLVVCKGREPMHPGLLRTEEENLFDDGVVVALGVQLSPLGPGPPGLLPQVPAVAERQKGLHQ